MGLRVSGHARETHSGFLRENGGFIRRLAGHLLEPRHWGVWLALGSLGCGQVRLSVTLPFPPGPAPSTRAKEEAFCSSEFTGPLCSDGPEFRVYVTAEEEECDWPGVSCSWSSYLSHGGRGKGGGEEVLPNRCGAHT